MKLDAAQPRAMSDHLRGLGWLATSEDVLSAERAGEGNMNYTLRVRTNCRTFILKQARPWVEKYPHIQAPIERAVMEGRFYQLAATVPVLAAGMPKLLGLDEEAHLLCLEDLGAARDFTSLYSGSRLAPGELQMLLEWLAALHAAFRGYEHKSQFANHAMRALNHQHIFVIPFVDEADSEFQSEVTRLGEIYLGEGECLLHGDYFPGSWLQTASGVKIIDPEFCFFGPPEFDLGVLLAHLIFAGSDAAQLQEPLIEKFAGIEIMRRLLGVAQLPLTLDARQKAMLLERAREMVLAS